jgi:hypothetical protein
VQDGPLVVEIRFGERIAAESEARIVEEDVHAAELRDRLLDERRRALLVRDVDVQRHVRLDPLDPPRPADDTHSGLAQLADRRRADAARRTGDDRSLALELHHRSLVTRRS